MRHGEKCKISCFILNFWFVRWKNKSAQFMAWKVNSFLQLLSQSYMLKTKKGMLFSFIHLYLAEEE